MHKCTVILAEIIWRFFEKKKERINKMLKGSIPAIITTFSKGCIKLILHKEFSTRLFLKSTPNKVINIIQKADINEQEKVYLRLKELASKCIDVIYK